MNNRKSRDEKSKSRHLIYFVKCGDKILSRGRVRDPEVKPEDLSLEFYTDWNQAKDVFVNNRRSKKANKEQQDLSDEWKE